MADLLQVTDEGIYCPAGKFHIDPWRPVARAVITHAHADHARAGCDAYLCADTCAGLLRQRLGSKITLETLPMRHPTNRDGVSVSLHPAGHILGSAQVRVEYHGQVWVVSGDYKLEPDAASEPFEPVICHTFISECTFGLPIYQWRPSAEVFDEINAWCHRNQTEGRASVLLAYSLGKTQRLLKGLDPALGPFLLHPAAAQLTAHYQAASISLPPTLTLTQENASSLTAPPVILAPPAAQESAVLESLHDVATAFVSGWMQLRGARRRLNMDRGFVLSDHADWPGLNQAIADTGAEKILLTHGSTSVMTRWLQEKGYEAHVLPTRYTGESLTEESQEESTGETIA